jgi:hypothetical protein
MDAERAAYLYSATRAKSDYIDFIESLPSNRIREISEDFLSRAMVPSKENIKAPDSLMKAFEEDLLSDLNQFDDFRLIKSKTKIVFLHDMSANGFAEEFPDESKIIAINYGLFGFSSMIAEAFLSEIDTPEAGLSYLNQAVIFFISHLSLRDHKTLNLYENPDALPIGDERNRQYTAGMMSAMFVRFCSLHELGHIVLGHTRAKEYPLFSVSDRILKYDADASPNSAAHIERELQSDEYAFAKMLDISNSNEQMWNNVFHIVACFRVLGVIESLIGKPICDFHPNGTARAQRLYELALSRLPGPSHDNFIWLDMVIRNWRHDAMEELELRVLTGSPEKIDSFFGEERLVFAHGLSLRLQNRLSPEGMTKKEFIFAITVSFASGIPSGIIANYIFNQLSGNAGTIIAIDNSRCVSLTELENAIESRLGKSEKK